MKKANYLFVTLGITAAALTGCKHEPGAQHGNKLEGEPCTINECDVSLACYNGKCVKVCTADDHCAKSQLCNLEKHVCQENPAFQCAFDEDCKTPGQCEVTYGAICQGGRCTYQPQEAGVPCNDERFCTLNDKCDGNKNCVGTPMECTTPPVNYCLNDHTFRVYQEAGHCEVGEGAPTCVYTYEDTPCNDCPKECGGFCDNINCTPLNQPGTCKEHVCDYKSENNPPCSPVNKINGTACNYIDEDSEKVFDGHCSDGTCVECTESTQCPNTSEYPECMQVSCENYKCSSAKTDKYICGGEGKCIHGALYSEDGTCASDGNSCKAAHVSCGNYQCNAEGNACLTTCEKDQDCKNGYYCNNDNQCTAKAADGQACAITFKGRDCQSGHCDQLNDNEELAICCADGNCCLDQDTNCKSGQKCQISTHQCISGDLGSSCLEHGDCHDGLYCDKLTRTCTSQLPDGRTVCGEDAECVSGHCDLSTTGPETGRCCQTGECCDNKDDCPADRVCKNSLCTEDDSDTPCLLDSDCNSLISYCTENKLGDKVCTAKKADGQTCNDKVECAHGFCVDGVCCESACTGYGMRCASRDFSTNDGHCLKEVGTDCRQDNECQSNSCLDGYCCANPDICKNPSSCSKTDNIMSFYSCGLAEKPGYCLPTTKECGHFTCNSTNSACLTTCNSDQSCQDDSFCNNNTCQTKLENGKTCTGGNQCKSGFCADGICCDSKCDGLCQSCNVNNSKGTCTVFTGSWDDSCTKTNCSTKNVCICATNDYHTSPTCLKTNGNTANHCSECANSCSQVSNYLIRCN